MINLNKEGITKIVVTASDMLDDTDRDNLLFNFVFKSEQTKAITTIELTKLNAFNYNHDSFTFDNDIHELKEGYYYYEIIYDSKLLENGRCKVA